MDDNYASNGIMEEQEEEEEEERWDEPHDTLASNMTISTVTPYVQLKDESNSSALTSTSAAIPSTGMAEPVNLMALNTNKAGMEGLDKEKINRIIMEASKGSRFYENEKKKEAQMNVRVDEMRQRVAKLTEQEKLATLTQVNRTIQELEEGRDLSRTIMHMDMDAFYAAVEMRDNPSLKDKPMAVGGMSMLSTSNYHARKFGVRAAMPGFIAKKLCPNLVIVPTSSGKYRKVSHQVREILAKYDPNFCPMSLDEAYLDMTDHLEKRQGYTEAQRTFVEGSPSEEETPTETTTKVHDSGDVDVQVTGPKNTDPNSQELNSEQIPSDVTTPSDQDDDSIEVAGATKEVKSVTFGLEVEDAVEEIRFRIHQRTQLTASAGIAPNCMLAKVCSDKNKPNGQYRIQPTREAVMKFVNELPIRKVSGIGKVTEKMLSALGIHTCAELYQQRVLLHLVFSEISSHHFLRISLGLGSTRVERDSERKSMSTERTFHEINKPEDLYQKCKELCEALAEDLAGEELKGKTVAIKIKTVKFEVKTRAYTVPSPVSSAEELFHAAKDLLKTEIRACHPEPLRLRLMGVRLSSLENQGKSSSKQDTITKFFKRKPPQQNPKSGFSGHAENDNSTVGGRSDSSMWKECNQDLSLNEDSHIVNEIDRNCLSQVSDPTLSSSIAGPQTSASDKVLSASCSTTESLVDSSSSSSSSLVCPICNKVQRTRDLEAFNMHVDVCLNRSAKQVDSYASSSKPLNSKLSSHTKSESSTSTDHEGPREVTPEGTADMTLDSSATESLPGPSSSALVCPICNKLQTSGDLEAFNTHVDMCLNKGAIKEILHQQVGTEQPLNSTCTVINKSTLPAKTDTPSSKDHSSTSRPVKRSGSGQQSASKRRKNEKQGSTLDKFFK